LPPPEQGVLVLLILFSTVAKIVFRLGLEGGFLRLYYEEKSDADRRGLVFTIAGFAALAASVLFGAMLLGAPAFGRLVLGTETPHATRYVALAAADVYLGTFAFVPLALLRIQDRPVRFALLNVGRNLANTVLKVAFLVGGFGISGVLWSDLLATGAWAIALVPTLLANASPHFRPHRLTEALRFGLPKAPHGLMLQLLNLADRRILAGFTDLATVGIYDKGYVLGAGVKFALSAFEPAWQPFVYGQVGKPDAPLTLARIVTYAWSAFVAVGLLVAVFGRELLMALTFTNPAFWAGAPVVPVVTLAYLLHGAFLLTSIGIGISKDTRFYPMITAAAAVTNLLVNFALIPRFGMLGAAWATVLAYAVMAGFGFVLSRRLYPIPFEGGRLGRVSGSALVAFLLSWLAPAALLPALAVKTAALLSFPLLLWSLGFLNEPERRWLRERLRRG
jgi:O-antigen/teichoic acid export membrane protein